MAETEGVFSFDGPGDSAPPEEAPRQRRSRRSPEPIDLPAGVEHGTRQGYLKGCGCEPCLEASREYSRRYQRGGGGERRTSAKVSNLKEDLEDFLMVPALMYAAVDPVCGQMALREVPGTVRDLLRAAERNKALMDILVRFSKGSVWAALLMHFLKMAAAIVLHHGQVAKGSLIETGLSKFTGIEIVEGKEPSASPDGAVPGSTGLVERLSAEGAPRMEAG